MTCAGCASLGLFELRFLCVCTKPCPNGLSRTSYVGLGLSPLGLVAFPSQLCQAGQEFWEGGTRARGMTVFFKCMQHALK